jgi:hypothetical protein
VNRSGGPYVSQVMSDSETVHVVTVHVASVNWSRGAWSNAKGKLALR